ncbi:unnamed protein product [Bursaphelenchus okinawaensis]|uniref:Cytochrome b561 domain-containing protein n=1 Tax=Bursaphelenchus okinawaensis TaxID=465554 RepID=A0A811LAP5_9BILA|nr:unnamed protein product [Bursaphelenchus okinawaensis]CAG9120068.1 unnamed protein product [Bursaphelenchus okinawaensis]
MTTEDTNRNYQSFDFLNVLGQIFLAVFVGSTAFVFGSTSADIEYGNSTTTVHVSDVNPIAVDFYAILTSIIIAVIQGESLTAFRVFRHDTKLVPTLYRLPLNIASSIFAILHLIALINHPTTENVNAFTNFYSWISIIIAVGYAIQTLFTLFSVFFPRNSKHLKEGFHPAHKVYSNSLFALTVLQIFIGMAFYSQALGECYANFTCENDVDVLLNVSMICLLGYGLITSTVSINSHWRVSNNDD